MSSSVVFWAIYREKNHIIISLYQIYLNLKYENDQYRMPLWSKLLSLFNSKFIHIQLWVKKMHERNLLVWNKMFAKICSKWRNISFERLINFAWNNYLGQLAECNCLGGNYLKGNNPGSNYPLDNYPGAICPGANFSRGDRFGGEWWGRLSGRQVPREAIVRRAIFLPGEPLSGKQLFRGQLSCNRYICFIALHCTFFY